MKKILYIAPSGNESGGGELYVRHMVRHIDRSRFYPIVMLPWDGDARPALEALDVEVHALGEDYWVVPPTPWYGFLDELGDRVALIRGLVEQQDIKLVHSNRGDMLEGMMAARLAGVHHVLAAHNVFLNCMPVMERLQLDGISFANIVGELSSRIVAVSESVAQTLSPPLGRDKVKVIHNGIELERFEKALASADGTVRAELGIPGDAVLVAAVGRVTSQKGFDCYVEAAARVLKVLPDVHFLVVGSETNDDEKETAAQLRTRVTALGSAKHVHFLGYRKDVARLLAESDIFVLSSRQEGHPYVLIEAMASRCSIVATKCQGVEETLVEGQSGYMVEIEDVEALAERIKYLARHRDERERMAETARLQAHERFELRRCIEATARTYDEVLALPAPTRGSLTVQALIHAAHEIGALGKRVMEMEQRLRSVESLAGFVRNNPLYRGVRRLVRGSRGRAGAGE